MNSMSGTYVILEVLLHFAPSLAQPGHSKTPPEGVTSDRWVVNRYWRCNPCFHARWRECQFIGQEGALHTKSILRTCACLPHVKTKTVTLACDHGDEIGLHTTTKDWMLKECCNWETCKGAYPDDENDENSTAVPCKGQNDLAVVLDTGEGKTQEEFNLGLDYAEALARAWIEERGSEKSTRFTFLIMGGGTKASLGGPIVRIADSETQLPDWVYKTIHTAPFRNLNRNTRGGISDAYFQFEGGHKDRRGWRKESRKSILIITDGIWDKPDSCNKTGARGVCKYANPHYEIEVCQNDSVNLFAIGIGNRISYENVVQLAGDVPSHAIHIDSWEQLIGTIAPISTMSCYGDEKLINAGK